MNAAVFCSSGTPSNYNKPRQTMKKIMLLCAALLVFTAMTGCKRGKPTDGTMVIYPKCGLQTDTIAIDSTYLPWCAIVTLKGYTQDTLFLSFGDGSFWKFKLIGNIDTNCKNDWYDELLPVTYHTKTTNDGDSLIIKYSFGV